MRLIDADKGLISKIQRETGCNFITAHKIVDSMPTVEKRKVGEWVDIDDKEEWYGDQYKCSLCGWVTLDNGSYCPNCGAEMRGVEND